MPKTKQQTYRFDAELWAKFEADCNLTLRSVRPVIEGLVRYWLDAGPTTREFIARHEDKTAAKTMPKQDIRSILTARRAIATQADYPDADPFDDQDLLDV
jgi:hypothetical protein